MQYAEKVARQLLRGVTDAKCSSNNQDFWAETMQKLYKPVLSKDEYFQIIFVTSTEKCSVFITFHFVAFKGSSLTYKTSSRSMWLGYS